MTMRFSKQRINIFQADLLGAVSSTDLPFQPLDKELPAGDKLLQATQKLLVLASGAIGGRFLGMQQQSHPFWLVIPKEGGVVQPAIFFEILGVAAALFLAEDIVIFVDAKIFVGEDGRVELFGPLEDWLRECGKGFSLADEGDKERGFVDDDGSSTAEASNERNACSEGFLLIDQLLDFTRDAEDNRRRGAFVDETKIFR